MHRPPETKQHPKAGQGVSPALLGRNCSSGEGVTPRPTLVSASALAFAITLAVFIALALPATAAEQKPLSVVVGQELTLKLESDSSGCQWLLAKPLDAALLKQSPSSYQRGPKGGHEILKFTALAEGKTELHLKYAKLWEKETTPSRQTNFVVIVTKEKANAAK